MEVNQTINITSPSLTELNVHVFRHNLLPSLVYVCILLVIGVPGNGLTCYVYGLKWKRTTSRVFILALASLDILNCVTSIPTEIGLLVNFLQFDFPAVCKISRFLTYVFNFSSSLILTAIAFDRHRRICQPFKVPLNERQGKLIVCVCIIVAVLTGSPALGIYGTQFVPIEIPETKQVLIGRTCLIENSLSHTKYPLIYYLWLLMTLFAMDVVLIILYSFIGRAMFQRKTRRESLRGSSRKLQKSLSNSADNRSESKPNVDDETGTVSRQNSSVKGRQSKKKGIRTGKTTMMLFLVTLVFVISFVPFTILVIMRFIDMSFYGNLSDVAKSVYHVFLRSYFMNSALNPLVYCFVSKQFRDECKKAITEDFIFWKKKDGYS